MLVAALAVALPSVGSAGRGADGDFEVRTSAHFTLYQDVAIDQAGGFHGSRRFEQLVLAELERAYDSLDRLLGLRPERKITVILYAPEIFDVQFAGLFRYPIAGFYGKDIVMRSGTEMTPFLRHVLHHELFHAALDMAAPSLIFPGWLNEGMAEWFEDRALGKRGLSAGEWGALERAKRSGRLFPYAELARPSFSHLGGDGASIAYLQSYGMVDHLARRHGERTLPELLDALIRARNLDRALQRVYRADLARLQERFFAELD